MCPNNNNNSNKINCGINNKHNRSKKKRDNKDKNINDSNRTIVSVFQIVQVRKNWTICFIKNKPSFIFLYAFMHLKLPTQQNFYALGIDFTNLSL